MRAGSQSAALLVGKLPSSIRKAQEALKVCGCKLTNCVETGANQPDCAGAPPAQCSGQLM
jgi:hypothetical protein